MRKGTPKMEFKKKPRGKLINGEWKEPWKSYNPNCAKCMYKNPEHTWASMGTCNYAGITGKPRITICKAKDCPGFPGKRIMKRNNNPLDM